MEINTTVTPTPSTEAATPVEPRRRSFGDVYTWLLIVSLGLLCIACGMLVLEFSKYGFQVRPVNV